MVVWVNLKQAYKFIKNPAFRCMDSVAHVVIDCSIVPCVVQYVTVSVKTRIVHRTFNFFKFVSIICSV